MTLNLVRKLLRDLRVPLVVLCLLLCGFECLWVKITERITGQLVPMLMTLAAAQKVAPADVEQVIFQGPGRIVRTLMGGEKIAIGRAMDILSIGLVHPTVTVLLCVWAVGRAANAVAGEVERGTMELLLAQPLARYRVILAHLCVDVLTIPLLCLSVWGGTWLGAWLVGPIRAPERLYLKGWVKVELEPGMLVIDPAAFGPALWNVAGLLFAVSGATMWLSARGRSRWRVVGVAVFVVLVQSLLNLVGQLWDTLGPLRPLTVFYYYQPQQIALHQTWTVDFAVWNGGQPLLAVPMLAVLFVGGAVGYGLAFWEFCRRDLPAPL